MDGRAESSRLVDEGIRLAQQGALARAKDVLKRAVELDPMNLAAWNGLGCCQRDRGRPQKAVKALRRALEIDDQHPLVWRNYGCALREAGSVSEAVEALRKSLALAPNDGLTKVALSQALHQHAVSLDQDGRTQEAVEALREALNLDPPDPRFRELLVGTLAALG